MALRRSSRAGGKAVRSFSPHRARPAARVRPLPRPRFRASRSFGEALRLRRTERDIGSRPLADQVLSNLLFAACGINRRRGPFRGVGRTAASASNSQEIDVYVLLRDGAYRFDANRHALVLVAKEDLRRLALGPHQPPLSTEAPVQLVYVVDLERLEHTRGFEEPGLHDPEVQKSYYFVDTGLIAGAVYLFAAAHDLACWFHHCDHEALVGKLGLLSSQRVLFAQTVGYASRAGA